MVNLSSVSEAFTYISQHQHSFVLLSAFLLAILLRHELAQTLVSEREIWSYYVFHPVELVWVCCLRVWKELNFVRILSSSLIAYFSSLWSLNKVILTKSKDQALLDYQNRVSSQVNFLKTLSDGKRTIEWVTLSEEVMPVSPSISKVYTRLTHIAWRAIRVIPGVTRVINIHHPNNLHNIIPLN